MIQVLTAADQTSLLESSHNNMCKPVLNLCLLTRLVLDIFMELMLQVELGQLEEKSELYLHSPLINIRRIYWLLLPRTLLECIRDPALPPHPPS